MVNVSHDQSLSDFVIISHALYFNIPVRFFITCMYKLRDVYLKNKVQLYYTCMMSFITL